ncbi:MAG: FAD:protein FMN transferase [Phycisphaerales bacterium]|nr:FAD:protein FMN transferase [Phycisphaerales bacterium]
MPARIVLYTDSAESARDAAAAAFSRIGAIERALSDYRPDSESSRLCSHAVGVPVAISPELFTAIQAGAAITEASRGEFDITIGPATHLWREARRTGVAPTADQLADAHARIGLRFLAIDPSARTATLARDGMVLDFGGIGKGMAAQAAVDLLRDRGFQKCLVALSGDIAVGDAPVGKPGWTIDLPPGVADRSLVLTNAAVSTSGDGEQAITINGRRESHILDPATGRGRADRRTVTVLAPRGELADGLSTAAWLMGPADAPHLITAFPGCAAVCAEGPANTRPRVTVIDPHRVLRRLGWTADHP